MRQLLIAMAILLSPICAGAFSDRIVDYCFTTKDPHRCITSFLADERTDQFNQQRELQQRQIDAQLEQARIQANGMALFGAGNALVQGMNQSLQNMQIPYNQPPGRR